MVNCRGIQAFRYAGVHTSSLGQRFWYKLTMNPFNRKRWVQMNPPSKRIISYYWHFLPHLKSWFLIIVWNTWTNNYILNLINNQPVIHISLMFKPSGTIFSTQSNSTRQRHFLCYRTICLSDKSSLLIWGIFLPAAPLTTIVFIPASILSTGRSPFLPTLSQYTKCVILSSYFLISLKFDFSKSTVIWKSFDKSPDCG